MLNAGIVVLALILGGTGTDVVGFADCSTNDIRSGTCDVGQSPDIEVSDTETNDGSDGSPGDSGDDGGRDREISVTVPVEPGRNDFDQCMFDWDNYRECFQGPDDPEESDPTPAIPPITITDLARFAPADTPVSAEPGNAGVAGLPANFVASASAQTVTGELFGYPIAVRFTPVGFDFDYGDGTMATTSDGGRSWDDLGQAQFTPTPTSHVYAERGEYTTTVNVRYSAEIDLGIGWFPIDGELTSAGAGQIVRIYKARTALVSATCEQNPSSPGC